MLKGRNFGGERRMERRQKEVRGDEGERAQSGDFGEK